MGSSEGFCSCSDTLTCWYCAPVAYCGKCGDSEESAMHTFSHDYVPPSKHTVAAVGEDDEIALGPEMEEVPAFDPGEEADPATVQQELAALRALADEMDAMKEKIDYQRAEIETWMEEYDALVLRWRAAEADAQRAADYFTASWAEDTLAMYDRGEAVGRQAGFEDGFASGYSAGWDHALGRVN